jgi:hypothetical protein
MPVSTSMTVIFCESAVWDCEDIIDENDNDKRIVGYKRDNKDFKTITSGRL